MRPNWLICGMMLSTSLLAQQVTNAPAAAPVETPAAAPAVTNSPAPAPTAEKPTASKPAKKSSVAELRTTPLVAGSAVVAANRVNVRGQARLRGEVIGQLSKGQEVTVLEEIILKNSGPDEPSAWAKILLPPGINVWIHNSFIDQTSKTVSPRRLNLRGGPGENFSVLGRVERGYVVKELSTKGDWTEIQAPTNAYAFVAAQYLKQEPAATAEPPATVATVTEPEKAAEPPSEPAEKSKTEEAAAAASTRATAGKEAAQDDDQPPPKRIVQREGFVRGSVSIQAPTYFELRDPENGKLIDYLYTTSPEVDLRRYKGMHIYVTGEEGLDERWPNTPVLTIHSIEVLE